MACSYLIINVNSSDLTSAFGNTDPSQNGKVFLTYSNCNCDLPFSESYSSAGTYTASTCHDPTCFTPYISYFQNDIEQFIVSSTLALGDPCLGPTPTPTQTPTNIPICNNCIEWTAQNQLGTPGSGQYYSCEGYGIIGVISLGAFETQTFCNCNDFGIPTANFGSDILFTSGGTCPTPTPTPTQTETPTQTPTETSTPTPTQTPTETSTNTPTPTETPTNTPSSDTPTPTPTNSETPTETPTNTPTPSETPTNTPTNSETPTQTPTSTETPTQTPTPTETSTQTPTPTETPTETPTQTPTPTETTTNTPTPSETPTQTPTMTSGLYSFTDCCDNSIKFNVEGIPGTLIVGEFYYLVTTTFTGCSEVISYEVALPSYTSITSTNYSSCNDCLISESVICPTNTPTPTETPTNTPTNSETPTNTPTPTETPTQTPSPTETCPNTYCLDTGGLLIYDGEYNLAGSHNSYDYYTGGTGSTGFIYYDTTKWCLSTALDGPCILFGKSPCNSTCPDLCDELQPGVCPPPPPPNPCETFEFEALFDCNFPLPSNTPTMTPTTTQTPTQTNTPSETQKCFGVSLSLSATTLPTSTPTPTPTVTPTNIDRSLCFTGKATYDIFDETLLCDTLNVLKDCSTGGYFYVNEPIEISGITIDSGYTLNVVIDGSPYCVYYEGNKTASKNATLNSVISVIGIDCSVCPNLPTPTQTPTSMTPTPTQTSMTPTPTPSSQTPTPTPTQTSTSQTPTPTPTQMTQTPTPTQTQTPDGCQQMYFVVCKSPSSSAITLSVSGNTLYNGKPYFKLDNSDMNVVFWDSGTTKWVSSVSGLTGTTENSLDNNGNDLPITTIDYQWEFGCDDLFFKNNVVVDSYLGPCITPTPTPTSTVTPTKTRNTCMQYEVFAAGGAIGASYSYTYTKCDLTPGSGTITNGDSDLVCGIENTFTSSSPFVGFGVQGFCP